MCGIAGIIDLTGSRRIERQSLFRMAAALEHRGPDEFGFMVQHGIGLASRRLSIVGLEDGQQPVYNEDRTVAAVFNGELFDFPEQRAELESKGHVFRSQSDSEVVVHLWEEHGDDFVERMQGQFAVALVDLRRREIVLARDRVGICPLHWSRQGDWLYFGSEVKSILASGEVPAAPDLRGLDNIFSCFALPGRRTVFAGIESLLPGTMLKVRWRGGGRSADVSTRRYWDFNFPDQGEEYNPSDPRIAVEEFRERFFHAVEERLRADVPVVSYLSGGVDSAAVVAAATKIRGQSLPTFTIQIGHRRYDEKDKAMAIARHVGADPTVVRCDTMALAEAYPELIRAADSPVIDTACASLLRLSQEVHRQGFKVALTGEGADEALAGYPWFKANRFFRSLDVGPIKGSVPIRWLTQRVVAPETPWSDIVRCDEAVGGSLGPSDFYSAVRSSRRRFLRSEMLSALADYLPYHDLDLNRDAMRRWDPLNQSLYLGYKTILPGLLLTHKGDRVAMANSVETRYPFLDEDVIDFCARLSPRWKLRGLFKDKQILRAMAEEILPRDVARRPKAMFRAPFGDTLVKNSPAFIKQLLSESSLKQTPYFDVAQVHRFMKQLNWPGLLPGRRTFVEMGLSMVTTTQLWHHLYLGGGLCELPTWSPPNVEAVEPLAVG